MIFQWPIILLVTAAITFSPCLFSSFHFDDHSIFSDPILMSSSGWWEVFGIERTRPLTYLTFWLNVQISDQNPFSFHLVNLTLHLTATWLVWNIFRRISSEHIAVIASLIFSLHPIQTETVTYVFARATLLATVLCLLCWKSWLQEKYWLAVSCFGLALLAKEEAACFPMFMLGADYFFIKKNKVSFTSLLLPVMAMVFLVAVATVRLFYVVSVTEGSGLGFTLPNVSPKDYLLVQPRVIFEYLRLVIWPSGLNFDRDFPLSTGFDFPTLLTWSGLALALSFTLIYVHKIKAAYWILGFFVLILPTSSFVPLADVFAERRVYLPMVSLSLGLGFLMVGRMRLMFPIAALVLGGLSLERIQVWQDEETLWRDTVKKSPAKVRPKLQLARALGTNAIVERFELLREAYRLNPSDPTTMTELGIFHLDTGNFSEAQREFRAVLDINPKDPQAIANYGVALYLLKDFDGARKIFSRALKIEPCNFDARYNAILIETSMGNSVSALGLHKIPEHCRFTPNQRSSLESSLQLGLP